MKILRCSFSLLAGTVIWAALPQITDTVIAATVSHAREAPGTTPVWSARKSMPTARGGTRVVTLNGKLYVLGGSPSMPALTAPQFEDFEVYDPVADRWSPKVSMPRTVGYSGAAAVGGRIYLIDGLSGAVHEYNPTRGIWVTKTSMPTPRTIFAIAVANGRIFTMGGLGRDPAGRFQDLASVEEYDPQADAWRSRTSLPGPRHAVAAATVGGKSMRSAVMRPPFRTGLSDRSKSMTRARTGGPQGGLLQ
jgi:hypothetical protein